jgi:uncharacterized membrane protein (UPF0127 family)
METGTHWLVVGSRSVHLEVADSPWSRLRGLLGRDGIDGALLLRPARSVHTFGMRFAIDVAFCDDKLQVLDISTLPPHKLSPRKLARPAAETAQIIEAAAGSFAVWGLSIGTRFDVQRVRGKAA